MKNKTILTLSFLLFANLLFPQKNLFVYKFLPHQKGFQYLYQDNICGVDNLNIEDVDSLVFYIFNEKEIKDGDIYIVFPKASLMKNINVNYTDFDFRGKDKKFNRRFRKIQSVFKKNKQFPDYLDRELLLIDAASIIQDTLSLTRNSTQLHSENVQRIITDKLLHDNKYVLVDLKKSETLWKETASDDSALKDKIPIIDLDTGEEILMSNMEPNRFYYTSKNSLFAFNLMIRDYIAEANENHTIFISKDNIPYLVYKNVPPKKFEEGDKKESMSYKSFNEDGELVSKSMWIVYNENKQEETPEHLYEFDSRQTSIEIDNEKNTFTLVDEKFQAKHLSMTDEEYVSSTGPDGHPILKPKKSSTVASPGPLKTFWIPATSALLVFLSAL